VRAYGEDPKKVRVVVLVKWDSEEDWQSIATRLQAVIRRFHAYEARRVDLEIIRGYSYRGVHDGNGDGIYGGIPQLYDEAYHPSLADQDEHDDLFSETPYMGASISSADPLLAAGTYGCTITLDDEHQYGLTWDLPT
jgi:hypothetical protein